MYKDRSDADIEKYRQHCHEELIGEFNYKLFCRIITTMKSNKARISKKKKEGEEDDTFIQTDQNDKSRGMFELNIRKAWTNFLDVLYCKLFEPRNMFFRRDIPFFEGNSQKRLGAYYSILTVFVREVVSNVFDNELIILNNQPRELVQHDTHDYVSMADLESSDNQLSDERFCIHIFTVEGNKKALIFD